MTTRALTFAELFELVKQATPEPHPELLQQRRDELIDVIQMHNRAIDAEADGSATDMASQLDDAGFGSQGPM